MTQNTQNARWRLTELERLIAAQESAIEEIGRAIAMMPESQTVYERNHITPDAMPIEGTGLCNVGEDPAGVLCANERYHGPFAMSISATPEVADSDKGIRIQPGLWYRGVLEEGVPHCPYKCASQYANCFLPTFGYKHYTDDVHGTHWWDWHATFTTPGWKWICMSEYDLDLPQDDPRYENEENPTSVLHLWPSEVALPPLVDPEYFTPTLAVLGRVYSDGTCLTLVDQRHHWDIYTPVSLACYSPSFWKTGVKQDLSYFLDFCERIDPT